MVKRFLDVIAVTLGIIGALTLLLAGEVFRGGADGYQSYGTIYAILGAVIFAFAFAVRYIAHGAAWDRDLEN
jgi:uncharacterized membrane protein YeaQ/YmgE (transglycosylase-associated protein family)